MKGDLRIDQAEGITGNSAWISWKLAAPQSAGPAYGCITTGKDRRRMAPFTSKSTALATQGSSPKALSNGQWHAHAGSSTSR